MIVLGHVLLYLNMLSHESPSDILNKPFNASIFPSSFYLTTRDPHYTMTHPSGPVCHPDLMGEEYMDGLSDEEQDIRKKYNFQYTKDGHRQYPMHDNHFRSYREEHKKDCRWKYYHGKCIVHTIMDDWYHEDHVVVKFEFQPQMAKQLASDLNETLQINFFNPSYEYMMEHNIRIGNVYICDKRKKLTGKCPSYDYDFIELDEYDEKKARAKKD